MDVGVPRCFNGSPKVVSPALVDPRRGEQTILSASQPPARPGAAPPQIAVIFKNLMARLGHDQFYIQGGDWGSIIGSAIATLYPENVLGFHSNLLLMQVYLWDSV
ncbi:jg7101 [Pararge aegeria aegeria]|uniref:Jg7101 protein n=1 Tax=Pararge aegeria aegeria TaxID=348720 RepID=A0A8S4R086_9NEOP|nr:jg7101 [Pararge aegeria aegeria]